MTLPHSVLPIRQPRVGSPTRSLVLGDLHEVILTRLPSRPSSMDSSIESGNCQLPLGPERVAHHIVRVMPTVIRVKRVNFLSGGQNVAKKAHRCATRTVPMPMQPRKLRGIRRDRGRPAPPALHIETVPIDVSRRLPIRAGRVDVSIGLIVLLIETRIRSIRAQIDTTECRTTSKGHASHPEITSPSHLTLKWPPEPTRLQKISFAATKSRTPFV